MCLLFEVGAVAMSREVLPEREGEQGVLLRYSRADPLICACELAVNASILCFPSADLSARSLSQAAATLSGASPLEYSSLCGKDESGSG